MPDPAAPPASKRITVHLDRTAVKVIKHLQDTYGTPLAEIVRRALDLAHTKLYHHAPHPFQAADHVPVSTAQPVLINMYLPTKLHDFSVSHAKAREISFPDYMRRAVIEYAIPAIRATNYEPPT